MLFEIEVGFPQYEINPHQSGRWQGNESQEIEKIIEENGRLIDK
jgi:hypothetical protein